MVQIKTDAEFIEYWKNWGFIAWFEPGFRDIKYRRLGEWFGMDDAAKQIGRILSEFPYGPHNKDVCAVLPRLRKQVERLAAAFKTYCEEAKCASQ